ncbi:hypothetical protein HF638_05950 [Paenibacillus sp. SZ31]|uniref:hypothetical protein n=1 Tax=Paenibacillus sp. SZ31 TaxID=2725555 RepID=UPI00146E65CF|nr:hypothetical protein [Paenibacillus sp. SZ31]NMI03510.1 hypothetical protein [Paenibacillus sp. SZ31]
MINFNEAVNISNTHVLALVPELFHLEGYNIHIIPPHEGGRNVVYTCEQEGRESLILRCLFCLTESGKITLPNWSMSGICLSTVQVSQMWLARKRAIC